jgi:hypothetical protein
MEQVFLFLFSLIIYKGILLTNLIESHVKYLD